MLPVILSIQGEFKRSIAAPEQHSKVAVPQGNTVVVLQSR